MTNPSEELTRLDERWNDAYRQHNRRPLVEILAEDFLGFLPSGQVITRSDLIVDPAERAVSVVFSEQNVRVFAGAAVAAGRLQLEFADRRVDQRYVRIYARRSGGWQAVSVAVMPL